MAISIFIAMVVVGEGRMIRIGDMRMCSLSLWEYDGAIAGGEILLFTKVTASDGKIPKTVLNQNF